MTLLARLRRLFPDIFRSRRKLADLPPLSRLACAEIGRTTLKLRGRGR